MSEDTLKKEQQIGEIEKKDMQKVFWRSFFIMATINYERFQALGYAYSMIPLIKKLYKTKDEQANALTRHMEMYNSHPWMVSPILGATSVLEEQNASGNKMEQAISNIKVGLMGPFAGIGDSLVGGTLMPILVGIGAAMALQGSVLGPIMFLIVWNIMNFGFRYWSLMYGRKMGLSLLKQVKASNIVQKISEGASVLGLLVLGVLVADWVNISIPLKVTIGKETQTVQEILDSIVPSLLPLLATVIIIFLLKRKISPNKILLGIFVFAFLFGGLGIFAAK